MFGWFKKKEVETQPAETPAPPKPKKVIKYEDKEFEVGVTNVLVTFTNGEQIDIRVYGNVYQDVTRGGRYRYGTAYDPVAGNVRVSSSIINAENMLYNLSDRVVTHVDDPKKLRLAKTGVASKMQIGLSDSYREIFSVASIVEE